VSEVVLCAAPSRGGERLSFVQEELRGAYANAVEPARGDGQAETLSRAGVALREQAG
jgi:hypothetical protein